MCNLIVWEYSHDQNRNFFNLCSFPISLFPYSVQCPCKLYDAYFSRSVCLVQMCLLYTSRQPLCCLQEDTLSPPLQRIESLRQRYVSFSMNVSQAMGSFFPPLTHTQKGTLSKLDVFLPYLIYNLAQTVNMLLCYL